MNAGSFPAATMPQRRIFETINTITNWYSSNVAPEKPETENQEFYSQMDDLESMLEDYDFKHAKSIVKDQWEYFKNQDHDAILSAYESLWEDLKSAHSRYNKSVQDRDD